MEPFHVVVEEEDKQERRLGEPEIKLSTFTTVSKVENDKLPHSHLGYHGSSNAQLIIPPYTDWQDPTSLKWSRLAPVPFYLAFFYTHNNHTTRKTSGFFGAYIFSAKPPFRIIAISAHPILHEELMTMSERHKTFDHTSDMINYPINFFIEDKSNGGGKSSFDTKVIHLFVEQNKENMIICRMDLQSVYNSLVDINEMEIPEISVLG